MKDWPREPPSTTHILLPRGFTFSVTELRPGCHTDIETERARKNEREREREREGGRERERERTRAGENERERERERENERERERERATRRLYGAGSSVSVHFASRKTRTYETSGDISFLIPRARADTMFLLSH